MNKQFGTDDGRQVHDRKAEVELQKTTSTTSATMKPDSQPTTASFSASRNLTRVPISEIVVGTRLRELGNGKVREIAESMARSGQRHAITVGRVGDQIMLVTGRHRLEGAKVLGWPDIEAEFIAGDDIDAQLWEIAENLFRAELTVLERAEHVAKYVELIALKVGQADHPVAGGKQPSDKGISRAARELPLAAKSEEARREEIGRALKVNAIYPEAKAAAKAAGLDTNRSALLKVANEPTAELQVKKTNENRCGKGLETARERRTSVRHASTIDHGWYGVGLDPGDGINTCAVRQADEAANDLARRIRAFRANPKAYSKYTHQFVHILDERWPKFDVQDHHFYPAREPYSSNQQRFAQH